MAVKGESLTKTEIRSLIQHIESYGCDGVVWAILNVLRESAKKKKKGGGATVMDGSGRTLNKPVRV